MLPCASFSRWCSWYLDTRRCMGWRMHGEVGMKPHLGFSSTQMHACASLARPCAGLLLWRPCSDVEVVRAASLHVACSSGCRCSACWAPQQANVPLALQACTEKRVRSGNSRASLEIPVVPERPSSCSRTSRAAWKAGGSLQSRPLSRYCPPSSVRRMLPSNA